jgi:Mg2+-importing ATPase
MPKKIPEPMHPWAQEPEELMKNFASSLKKGLTFSEVKRRQTEHGLNEIARKGKKPAYLILFEQFLNPLVLVLIVASIISFFLGEQTDAMIIIGIVIFNAVMGFVQEFRAEKTVRALSKLISRKAKVLRDGKKTEIDAKYIVPGDIVYLSIGDIVPADIRILHQDEMTIDESSLTGESVAVLKNTNITPSARTLPQYLKNIAFMGTHVMSGDGYGIVINTGEKTYFGKTASYLKKAETVSDFEKSISNFSRFLLKIILIMTVCIFGINAFLQHGIFDSFLFALALAVGITPEALPVIITISLSKGAQNLAKAKVVVKKLSSIEDLGNMDVLCTDKTGTLTEGKLTLENYLSADEKKNDQLLIYGMLCNSAIVGKKKVEGNMIDKAIWESPDKKKVLAQFKKFKIIDNNEFDFERRRMSVLVSGADKKRILVVKGALESLEPVCEKIMLNGKVQAFNKANAATFKKITDKYRLQGYSTICIASKEWKGEKSNKKDESGLTLMGFLIFHDPPRKTARAALEQMKMLGVDIKVLSGDDPLVTEAICKKVGLEIRGGKILTGDDLDKMDAKGFLVAIEKYNVFSRIAPEHKYRIVQSLNSGPERTVAFMGDGINDAPAIKVADVGISVNTATDIAKEAADIILMQKSLNVVVEGIIEGRKIFTNITKYILNTVSANYGNMFTVAGSSLFLKFIPLLPSQILLNNLITDTPMVAIATDNIDPDQLKKPKKLDIAMIRHFMIFFGLLSTFFDMTLILTLLFVFKADPMLFRTAWFFESAMSEVLITFSIRTKQAFFRSRPGKLLLGISLCIAVLLFALVTTPLGSIFELTTLPLNILFFVFAIITCYFISAEVVKKFFFKKFQF